MWPLELCFYYMENCYPSPGLLFLLGSLWLILASCDQSASQLNPMLLKIIHNFFPLALGSVQKTCGTYLISELSPGSAECY